jgi:hypothetical protein
MEQHRLSAGTKEWRDESKDMEFGGGAFRARRRPRAIAAATDGAASRDREESFVLR